MKLTEDRWDAAHDVLDAVIIALGPSRYWGDPELLLVFDPSYKFFGWYAGGRITVNFWRCHSWCEVVATILHEYAHHLQDPARDDVEGFELEARAFTTENLPLFWKLGDRAP